MSSRQVQISWTEVVHYSQVFDIPDGMGVSEFVEEDQGWLATAEYGRPWEVSEREVTDWRMVSRHSTVEVFLNVDPRAFARGYRPGDLLVGCEEYLRFEFTADGEQDDLVVAERAFEIGNRRRADDVGRLYLPQIRSLSVGDVLRVEGERWYAVAPVGFRALADPPVGAQLMVGAQQLVRNRLAAPVLTSPQQLQDELARMGMA